jgi:lysophospholipase L1-like esterase
MPGRIYALLSTGLALLAVAPATAAAKPRYYVALGDSLSQGVQPDLNGKSLETDQGYPDQLYALEKRRIPTLQLVKLGCPGDTTTSMLTGKGNAKNAASFHCARAGGSQLAAAEKFLKAHGRQVSLITVDIGANDVDGCTNPGVNLGACLTAGEATIKGNTPKILQALKRAAAKSTKLAAMNLYDPILSDFFSAVPATSALWSASIPLAKLINGLIETADAAAGFKTADVAGAFATYDSTSTVAFRGQQLPLDVARVCSWTWACTSPPSGPNIHANTNGYAVIAGAFSSVIGRL